MFGTMGISELIIILVIVLIIFGAGKLPQIGEGVGKALKGFKKEVNDIPPPETTVEPGGPVTTATQAEPPQPLVEPVPGGQVPPTLAVPTAPKASAPYTPGPELT